MRLLPPLLFLAFTLVIAVLHGLLPAPRLFSGALRLAGLPLLVGGLAVTVAAARQFARRRTNIHTFQRPTRLVTDGLFAYSRNPMYLGFSVALLGIAVLSGTVPALLAALLFAVVCDRWYIRYEEARMREVFGAEYEAYARATRRWL